MSDRLHASLEVIQARIPRQLRRELEHSVWLHGDMG